MKYSIAVIIATRNEEDTIADLIKSLKEQSYAPKEIIVVDGNSSDSTREVAKKAGARVIPETGEKRCPSNAWNIGARSSKSDLICILGADFFLEDKDFFKTSVEYFKNKNVIATYATSTPTTDTFFKKITGMSGKSIQPMLIRKSVFDEVNGYPVLGYGEEMILTKRLHEYCAKNKSTMPYVQNAHFGGHPVGSFQELFWQAEWYGRTTLPFLKVYKKNFGLRNTLKQTLLMSIRSLYSLSFLVFLYSYFSRNILLSFPFIVFLLIIGFKNAKNPIQVLKVFTNIVYGFGFIYGFLRYVTGINRGLGRK